MLRQALEVFLVFLRLGCTSFGGPIAHLSYFHQEFVIRRKWFDEQAFAETVALCQFLPGPASSQVGMVVGLSRAGIFGALCAWVGFTLPSFVLLMVFAFGISNYSEYLSNSWLHGLKIVAVAVVAQALWSMAVKLTPDRVRIFIAAAVAITVVLMPMAVVQVAVIVVGGVLGFIFFKEQDVQSPWKFKIPFGRTVAVTSLAAFVMLLLGLPLFSAFDDRVKVFESFYRAGSLVFGGGHVVLPLLKTAVVDTGWVSADKFLAGYGASQALPGPLFTFAGYLGAVSTFGISGFGGAVFCLVAIFLPSFLMVFGVLPIWGKVSHIRSMRAAMAGINAAVVGLLAAALYNPVWVSAIFSVKDFVFAAICLGVLMFTKTPVWSVVILGALAGGLLY